MDYLGKSFQEGIFRAAVAAMEPGQRVRSRRLRLCGRIGRLFPVAGTSRKEAPEPLGSRA